MQLNFLVLLIISPHFVDASQNYADVERNSSSVSEPEGKQFQEDQCMPEQDFDETLDDLNLCTCLNFTCSCCLNFVLGNTSNSVQGCILLIYSGNMSVTMELSFDEKTSRNSTLLGNNDQPICTDFAEGLSRFCGRLNEFTNIGDCTTALLYMELRSSDVLEASLKLSKLGFGRHGIKNLPSWSPPSKQSVNRTVNYYYAEYGASEINDEFHDGFSGVPTDKQEVTTYYEKIGASLLHPKHNLTISAKTVAVNFTDVDETDQNSTEIPFTFYRVPLNCTHFVNENMNDDAEKSTYNNSGELNPSYFPTN